MYNKQLRIIRKPEVLATLGISKSTLFNRIQAGLLPPSINLGGRACGWLETEIQAVLSALVSSRENNEIKQLVNDLVEARKTMGGLING
ncbi:helix-turn-helix transcriptional regulator [Bermanella sp. WJH001]|uniref:helix-turn-helix transcriptional regulator n=1 Tax=Bermanella sp. WJH001 TaxID=3048005 RepID=UPI0024BEDE24|nr:AlpA family phage regulatory protein [Bermanella sp. WJH001]MDJ1539286.1 AlpA family phage regulatory protein [Bermanella sp. WJH001]